MSVICATIAPRANQPGHSFVTPSRTGIHRLVALREKVLRSLMVLAVGGCLSVAWTQSSDEPFTLTILHTNDFHSHADPTAVGETMLGGYARLASAIIDLRANSVNPILLNAGDTFQGTLYFSVYEGLSDLSFMNLIGFDAMTVGNHEFDKGPEVLAKFATMARFPLLAANLEVTLDSPLTELIRPSTVLDVEGERVGIVGAVTPDLPTISSPGPTIKMVDYVRSVQAEVDRLHGLGINKIVLLSHSGIEHDLQVVPQLRRVDAVVGGHSHTLMGEITGRKGPHAYPTLAKDRDGRSVPVVQAWEWGKVVGQLVLEFDKDGYVTKWSGQPVAVDGSYSDNPFVMQMFEAFRMPLLALQKQKVGEIATALDHRMSEKGEPLMGSVIADAVLEATRSAGAQMAFWNYGGVRAPLPVGDVTYSQLIEVTPFGNTLVVLELSGAELLAALEHGARRGGGLLLPSKGFSYTIKNDAPGASTIVSATFNGLAVSPTGRYKVAFSSFTASGGDDHQGLKNAKGLRVETGLVDIDALVEFVRKTTPVRASNEGRIVVQR